MRYSPRHVYQRAKGLPRRVKATAILVVAAGLVVGATGLASAANAPSGTTSNTSGEAGYYVNEANNWHIRDAHAKFTITQAMENMGGGAAGEVSAVGTELCNPETSVAAQIGLVYLPGVGADSTPTFEVLGNFGTLTSTVGAADPCVQDGVLATGPTNGAIQLAGADGLANGTTPQELGTTGVYATAPSSTDAARDSMPLAVGDSVVVDVYYDALSKSHHRALQYTLNVYNAAGASLGQRTFIQYVTTGVGNGQEQFYEAGIGVNSTAAPTLTAPADNPLADFSDATFTNYDDANHSALESGWDLVEAQTVNGGGQVTLAPTVPVGNSFNMVIGSESS
jgi:hypothetical protein